MWPRERGSVAARLASTTSEVVLSEFEALWDTLGRAADPAIVASIKSLVKNGSDRELNHLNPIAYATAHGLAEDRVIAAFLQASKLGLFDLCWNMICSSCGGVLETGSGLRAFDRSDYFCSFCDVSSEPTLDELVEVAFTVNPRIRRIEAHNPDGLPLAEYARQIFWGSGVDFPTNVGELIEEVTLDAIELEPGERAVMSLTLPAGNIIILDPISHSTRVLQVEGEEAHERRNVSVILRDPNTLGGSTTLQPGPVRITLENKSLRRALPALWLWGDKMMSIFMNRRPFLTATRVLSNQTFRDLYRTGTLTKDQRFKITNLTILFTDLRGSTALYDRIGDLAAFDLVRDHFGALLEAIAGEGGAVVKTIGDAVMATFPTPDRAIRAALGMRVAMHKLNEASGGKDLALNVGLHGGPCLAVMLDDRQDYFGQTVNVASRVQGLADPTAILATQHIIENEGVARVLQEARVSVTHREDSMLRGVSQAVSIYAIA
jgi:class 3 adenylate cyclase